MNHVQRPAIILFLSFLCFSCRAFSQGTWTSKTPMPVPLYGAASGVINGQLYAASGCCVTNSFPFTRFNTLQVYDPAANTWATKATIPHAIYGAAAGVIDGKLYVAGGQADPTNGNIIADLQIYDPASDTWTTGTPLPEATQGGNAGVINGKLYVAGGSTSSGIVSTVVVYDPVANTWTNVASMPNPRASAGTAVINGILYVVGGAVVVNSTSVAVNTVDSYNPATDTWTTLASMPTARIALAAVDIDGILYAAGGQDNINTTFATVEAYNPSINAWTTAPSMLVATHFTCCWRYQ